MKRQPKRNKKRTVTKRSRPASQNAEAKKHEEFWSDPCWQEPLDQTTR